MPRKKTTKKRSGQRQKSNHTLLTVETMEQDLLKTPSQLSAYLDKFIPALQKKEKQLSSHLHKIQDKIKTNDIQASKKNNNKQKQAKLKKNNQELLKNQTFLMKELKDITFMIEKALVKKEKWQVLGKELKKLEKSWKATSKKPSKTRSSQSVQYGTKKITEKIPASQVAPFEDETVFQPEVSDETTEFETTE